MDDRRWTRSFWPTCWWSMMPRARALALKKWTAILVHQCNASLEEIPNLDPKVLMFFVMSDPSLKPATLFPFKVSVWLPVIIHVLFDLKIFPHKNQPHHGVFPWLFLWLKGYPLKKRFILRRNSPWLWNHAAEPCVSGNLAPAPGSKNRDAICQAETGDTAMPRNFLTDEGMTWESHGNVTGNWSSINGNMMGFHEYDD